MVPTVSYYPNPPNNELCQGDVQKESQYSSEALLYLMITAPEVTQVATSWDHEIQADTSFFLGGSTDIASFFLPFHSQHHLGCARLTSKLDITAAASLTFTTSPFTSCAVTALIYSQRTNPGATVTSASAAAARPFLLRRLRSEFLYYNPSKQGRCHNHFQTLPVLQAYSFWTLAYILQSCLY